MGGGSYDRDTYNFAADTRKKSGVDDFAFSKATRAQSMEKWKCHPLLDPKAIRTARESRDSAEHPTSKAVAIFFDETGSMGTIPVIFQKKLNDLMEMIKAKGGLEHPQILIGAIGDSSSDQVPLQVGQFESDNRIDEQLRLVFIEGNGGGQMSESYMLAHYVAGYKTSTDCHEKRGEKGYLFTMGDEMPWPGVTRGEALTVLNDVLDKDLSAEEVLAKAQEKYHVFHIIITGGNHGRNPAVESAWRNLLDENVLRLDNPNNICELITDTIASVEKSLKANPPKTPTKDTSKSKKKKGRV